MFFVDFLHNLNVLPEGLAVLFDEKDFDEMWVLKAQGGKGFEDENY